MTGNGAKTLTGDEKSLVEVHRKSAKMLALQRFGPLRLLFVRRSWKIL